MNLLGNFSATKQANLESTIQRTKLIINKIFINATKLLFLTLAPETNGSFFLYLQITLFLGTRRDRFNDGKEGKMVLFVFPSDVFYLH